VCSSDLRLWNASVANQWLAKEIEQTLCKCCAGVVIVQVSRNWLTILV